MRSKNMTLAAVAGGALAAIAAIVCLTGGKAVAASPGTAGARGPAPKPRAVAARPRAAYAVTAPAGGDRGHAAPNGAASESVASRARDLVQRLQVAAGAAYELPADLRRDLLAFLAGGDENRDALFALAWAPSTPRVVVGHLKLFLMNLEDAQARGALMAAFDSCDPGAAGRAAVASRVKDPSVFVASLRAAATAKERVDLMRNIPKEAWTEPAIAAWLLESAREDADEDVRGNAYMILAFAGNADVLPVVSATVADGARSVTERKRAAFAMAQLPVRPSVDELFRMYEAAPDEVRRNLLPVLAATPAGRRVDDLLLDVLGAAGTTEKTRKAAAVAIESRLGILGAAGARDLGTRTAEVIKALDAEKAVLALNAMAGAVCHYEPLKEALRELERTAPAGGAIQVALASTPVLRFALGRN